MPFSPFIATRYLKPKRTFVSIITVISILGVALGVWLLTVVIAVFTGYGEKMKETILGFQPHLVIKEGGVTKGWYDIYEQIKEDEGIASVTGFVTGPVLVEVENESGKTSFAPKIQGILQPEGDDLERMSDMIAIKDGERQGEFYVGDPYSAVVGDGIAKKYHIKVGDQLLINSPRNLELIFDHIDKIESAESDSEREEELEKSKEVIVPQEVIVKGIFNSGHATYDSQIIFTNLETAQILYRFDLEEAHGIAVRLDDAFQVEHHKTRLDALLPDQYLNLTWKEMNAVAFNSIAAERQMMYLIISMIMIVSSFCIMNTMITVTYQKKTEIGLMKAIGAREPQIAWIFIFQGIIVGVIGVVLGLIGAQVTIANRNRIADFISDWFGVDIFSSEAYGLEGGLPAVQTTEDLILISVGAFAACILASVVPAIIAANLQPANALRRR